MELYTQGFTIVNLDFYSADGMVNGMPLDFSVQPNASTFWLFTYGYPADDVMEGALGLTENGNLNWVIMPLVNVDMRKMEQDSIRLSKLMYTKDNG